MRRACVASFVLLYMIVGIAAVVLNPVKRGTAAEFWEGMYGKRWRNVHPVRDGLALYSIPYL